MVALYSESAKSDIADESDRSSDDTAGEDVSLCSRDSFASRYSEAQEL